MVLGLRDRSDVIRKLNGQTIAYLAPIASDDLMEKLLIKMKNWYLEKQGHYIRITTKFLKGHMPPNFWQI